MRVDLRAAAVLILAVILAVILTGCMSGVPLEELLKPPKLSGEQLEIYNALMKGKSGSIKLKYPKSGDYRSAFVIADFSEPDEDGVADTAIVFYELSGITAERNLWLNFLARTEGGEWESVYDLSIKGTDIERISFFPLGDDAGTNILVSYAASQSEKAFVLIKYKDKTPMKLIEGPYSYIEVGEFLDRGTDELLVIRNDYALETATASFYTWSGGRFVKTGSCELDPSAGEYTGITEGKLSNNTTALFINHRKYSNRDNYGTDIIYTLSNLELANLALKDEETLERVQRRTNSYTELANPMDINGDGFVELCSSLGEFPGYSVLGSQDKVRPVIWRALIQGNLEELYYSYYSNRNDFVFLFPNRWKNSVTVKISTDGRQVSFYEAAAVINDSVKELLAIAAVPAGTAIKEDGWTLRYSNTETAIDYYIRISNPDDPLTLTEDEFTLGFRILSRINKSHEP